MRKIIIKKRDIPESILFLKRGLVRVKKRRREIELALRNTEQGYRAECELDFYLNRIGVNSRDIIALYDLRLPASDGRTFFQIDTLLLTPHFGLIIDVKSQAGQFTFQNNARTFQYVLHQKKYQMRHPILQIDEQRDQLRQWLGNKWMDYPFVNVAALTNGQADILTDSSSEWVHEHVMPMEFLKDEMKRASKKYTQALFQTKELIQIGHQLANAHCPPMLHFGKKFELGPGDVEGGTLCPFCNRLAMDRLRVIWECPYCRGRDRRAHVMTLKDYFVYVKPTITNQECREFLGVKNEYTARVLLMNSGIVDWKGTTRNRIYFMKK